MCCINLPRIPTGWGIYINAGVYTVLLSLPGVVKLTDNCPSLACAELFNSLMCRVIVILPSPIVSYLKLFQLLKRAWASPTLAGLHCETHVCMCVCLLTVWPYIPKVSIEQTEINLRYMYISNLYILLKLFKIYVHAVQVDSMHPSLSNSMPMDLLNATEDSSPRNSTLMNLLNARPIRG